MNAIPPAAPAPVLAIDAGNTRVKWALRAGDAWAARGAVATADARTLGGDWPAMPPGTRALGSNVGGPAVLARLHEACARHALSLSVIVSRHEQLGVRSAYRDPAQLGTDRWAALIAAHHAAAVHQIVVNAGTALTVDALRGDGLFAGGLIVPGIALMRRSLDGGTAQLRQTEGVFDPFPKSTPDAITTGSVQAAVGAIERMREAMAAGGFAPERILLSGGAAPALGPHLPMPVTLDDNLVLDGLVLIARAS
ncbi:MAG: type III pantothenate kinase [Betaproteobacteria bacterium]|nr:type III pantothenate kinase [Betaproteobacteria bacterium]